MKRKITLDIIRLASILGVITIHLTSKMMGLGNDSGWLYVFNNAARFSVPTFIIISALLYFERDGGLNLKDNIRKRAAKLVPPYIFFTVIYFLFTLTPWTSRPLKLGSWVEGAGSFIVKLLTGGAFSHLYFMPIIIILSALYPLLKRLYLQHRVTFSLSMIAFFVFSNYYGQLFLGDDKLYRWTIFPWSIFVLIGFIMADNYSKIVSFFKARYQYLLLPPVVCLFYFYLYQFSYLGKNYFALGMVNQTYLYMILNLLFILAAIYSMFYLTKKADKLNSIIKKNIKILSNSAFGVYLIHYLLLDTAYKIALDAGYKPSTWTYPLWLLLIYVMSNILYYPLDKFFMRFTPLLINKIQILQNISNKIKSKV